MKTQKFIKRKLDTAFAEVIVLQLFYLIFGLAK
jgi:hypothetical protein